MTENRRGEIGPTPFRSGRLFQANGTWYISTRENKDKGPFPNRQEAEAALVEFLRNKATENYVNVQ